MLLKISKGSVRQVFLILMFLIASHGAARGQEWGTIIFGNRNIPIAAGGLIGGGNGNGTYNVPIWDIGGAPNGAGDLAGGVTIGLFLPAGDLLASSLLRTDANSQFFATASQTVTVPFVPPGSTTALVVRGWQRGPASQPQRVARAHGPSGPSQLSLWAELLPAAGHKSQLQE